MRITLGESNITYQRTSLGAALNSRAVQGHNDRDVPNRGLVCGYARAQQDWGSTHRGYTGVGPGEKRVCDLFAGVARQAAELGGCTQRLRTKVQVGQYSG